MYLNKLTICTSLLLTFIHFSVNAGVSVGATRVIYNGKEKETSLSVSNPDKTPYLIQTWIETPEKRAEKIPFIITPPLFRLEGEQQNRMRIVRAGQLPEDRESLYWLNVKAIPSSEKKENTLQIALKTRIKLIYRPESLKSNAEAEAPKLIWSRNGNELKVNNPTSYYMNFNEITVGGKKIPDVVYASPGVTTSYRLPADIPNGQITFKLISDYGSVGSVHKASSK